MRLTRITLLLITLVIVAGFYQLTRYLLDDVEPQILQATEEVMVDVAHVFSELVSQETKDGKLDNARLREIFTRARVHEFQAQIFSLQKQQVGLNLYVTDAKGKVIFDSDGGRREGLDYTEKRDVSLTLNGQYGARSTREAEDDSTTSIMYVGAPLGPINAPLGVVTVFKKQADALPMIAERRSVILRSIISIGLGILLLIAAVFWWVYQPIGILTEYARSVEKGLRPPKPKLGAGREVNTLYHALETMREALEGRGYVERYTQTLTHEMKSPLAAIRGAAELLHEEMPQKNRDRFLENIRSETSRAERLISRLLELSAVESKSRLDAVETLDFCEIVRRALKQAEPIGEIARVTLDAHLPDRIMNVEGDAFVLRAAVTNLVENAIDFSSAGAVVVIDLYAEGDEIVLTIDDRGPGIPEYALGKVFDRFYSLRHHQSGRKGTGLGLNLVKEAAELHHGSITLENRAEGGARAMLRFPTSGYVV
jgi:two-component system sensor histidine kinase CreC